jgi:hypothetical protein
MSRPTVVIACMLAPPNRGDFNSTHFRGTHVPVEEPSTASEADVVPTSCVFGSGFATSRAQSTKSWATGLPIIEFAGIGA